MFALLVAMACAAREVPPATAGEAPAAGTLVFADGTRVRLDRAWAAAVVRQSEVLLATSE